METRRTRGRTTMVLLTLVACSLLPELARGFSMGAPDSACANMLPGHGGVKPQDTISPFRIQMVPWTSKEDRRFVNVTLVGEQGVQFAGFLLQARPETGGNALGTFVIDTPETKTHTCGRGLRNSVTHNNKTPKSKLQLLWEAPEDYTGVVVFNATFVRDYSTFWTSVQSDKFHVRSRADSAAGPGLETSSRRPTTRAPVKQQTPSTPATTTVRHLPVVAGLAASIYSGCGTVKGCFGTPTDCHTSQACQALVTYQVRGEIYEFELYTHDMIWVGAAFSDDADMASDSVMECVNDGGRVNMYASWNEASKGGNHRVNIEDAGMTLLNSSLKDNEIYCRFTRNRLSTVENVQFDLSEPYFLFVATGPDLKASSVGYHANLKDKTAEKILLSDATQAKSASKLLVRLHGAFMLAAWIATASCGILLARYFKQTWVGSQLCAKDQWFAWHRMLMVLTWCLTVAAFIIIFVDVGAWSSEQNPHAILGVITTALAFIQPFMAALRPHPGARRRPIFNWFHWLVGNLAHIFGIVTIYFAVLLVRAELPKWMHWILVGFVAFHVFMHLIFSVVGCASDRQGAARVTAFPMKDMGSSRNPLHAPPDRRQDAPYSTLRKVLLAFYIIGVFGLAIAMIVITVLAPIENTWKDVKAMVGLK